MHLSNAKIVILDFRRLGTTNETLQVKYIVWTLKNYKTTKFDEIDAHKIRRSKNLTYFADFSYTSQICLIRNF